jgi:hypothetical protein
MTAALGGTATVAVVDLVLCDDGTNRRARFDLTYASGEGPASVFIKAESDVPGRREIHARNGNLYNEALLYRSGTVLPIEHPHAYCSVVDEANLDYVIVMEDLLRRDADPRDPTRPLTVEQVASGVRGLARLHSRYWNRVSSDAALDWVQPFVPTEGWRAPLRALIPKGMQRAADAIPDELRTLRAEELVDVVWAGYVRTLAAGAQTLLHGDPHIGNTYVLPDGEVGFLDWQVVRRGNCAHDVGYFLQSALTPPDRRRHEKDLVEEHRRSLDVPDSERPSAEDAWLRYRGTPAHGLTLWLVTLLSDVHARERSLALVERFASAFAELDTLEALEELAA